MTLSTAFAPLPLPAPARPSRHGLALLALAAAAGLAGCASPGTLPPAQAALSPAAAGLADDARSAFPDSHWWQRLGDPALDALVERALAAAPSLQQLQARLAQAEARQAQVRAAQSPQANAAVDITRQRFTEHGIYPQPLAGNVWDMANAQVGGQVELDFFGRHAAQLRAALGAQRAAAADAQAARVLLATQVVRGHVALARLLGQHAVAQRTLEQRLALLALTQQRVQAGLDTRLELKTAEGSVPDARLQLAQLDEQVALARHQLAALTGQAPDALDTYRPTLAAAQPLPLPDRLGADLLGRRADVVAARWRVEAAAGEVALARTQFYPDINLVGFVGLNAIGVDNLFTLGSRQLGIGPALRLPVFDAGRLRAQLRGKAAEADAAVAAYNALLLDVVREAADAGTSVRAVAQQQQQAEAALAAAEEAYAIAQQRYRAGISTQLQLLAAEGAVLQQRRQAVDLQARRLDAQAQLARALGGGWQPDEALSAPAVAAATR